MIYKGKPAYDVHANCFINQHILVSKHFLCFIHMPSFDVNPAHSFINEVSGLSQKWQRNVDTYINFACVCVSESKRERERKHAYMKIYMAAS